MFLRSIQVQVVDRSGHLSACPVSQIDSFCMRNFTNDAVFDDTLPIADGLLEIGNLVPLADLHASMEVWFRRKLYLRPDDSLLITELTRP